MRVEISRSFIDRSDRWIGLLLMGYSLGVAVWLLANLMPFLVVDDGFYYFKIAQNLARGEGPSFDGINPTNGYHPLWLLCLVPIFWLTKEVQQAYLLGEVMQAVLMMLSVVLIYQTARLTFGRLASAVAALLWVEFTYRIYLGGMEFSLHALGVLAMAYIYLRWLAKEPPAPAQFYLGAGLVLSLTFLARLDTLLLAGIVGFWLAWDEVKHGFSRAGLTRLLALSVPVVLACFAYIAVNLYLFQHPLPVSNALKQNWSLYLLTRDPQYQAYGWLVAKFNHLIWPPPNFKIIWFGVFGVGGLWLLSQRYRPWRTWYEQVMQPWSLFVIYSFTSYLSFALLYHGELSLTPWYFVIQRWLVAMVGAALINKIVQTGPGQWGHPAWISRVALGAAALFGAGVILLTGVGLAHWRAHATLDRRPYYAGVQWIRHNLPDEAIIGAWNAGTLGYLSERRVVNLDGLVNSWAYYETERHNLCDYWDRVGITYLVDVFRGEAQILSIMPIAPNYASCAGRLELLWQDERESHSWSLRVYRIQPVGDK